MALPIKGYQIDDKLYISPESPIRYWDFSEDGVDYIYVQQEDLEIWKEANDKFDGEFIPYNFKLMCVQVPIWEEHLNDEWPVEKPEPEPEDVVHNMGPWQGELDEEGIYRYLDMTALQESDSFFTSEQELLANAHLLTFSAQVDTEDPLVVTWPGTLSLFMRTEFQTLYYDPEVEDGEHYLIAYNNDTQSADVYLAGIQYTENATITLTKSAAEEEPEPEPEPEENPL